MRLMSLIKNMESNLVYFTLVLLNRWMKKILKYWLLKVKKVITVEENVLDGGFGSSILEFINTHLKNIKVEVQRVGLPNKFVKKYGSQDELHKYYELDKRNLVKIATKNDVITPI